MNNSSSRDAYFYAALQSPGSAFGLLFKGTRLLTLPQLAVRFAPPLFLLIGVLLGYALLPPEDGKVGWMQTGGHGLRAFSFEPVQVGLDQTERGPLLRLRERSLLVKYRADATNQQVQLRTPHAAVAARDAVFFVEVREDQSLVGVQRGEVVVFADGENSSFAGPGELVRVAGAAVERGRQEHRHFASLDLIFPHPGIGAPPSAADQPEELPPQLARQEVEGTTSVRVDNRASNRPVTVAKRGPGQARGAKRSPKRARLPNRSRRPAPQAALPKTPQEQTPVPAPDTPPAHDDLGAPVLVPVPEDADLGAPVIVPLDEVRAPEPATRGDSSVFSAPPAWWD